MIRYERSYIIPPDWHNSDWIMEKAQAALKAPVLHITDVSASGRKEHSESTGFYNSICGGVTSKISKAIL